MLPLPKWENLLPEILSPISKRLTSIGDFISFRGVCRSWRSAATFDNFDTECPRLPCLMFVAEETEAAAGDEKRDGKHEKKVTKIWDVTTNTCKITNFPPFTDHRLSCFGWVLCDSSDIYLRHFLLPISIKLPGMGPSPLISKMVLSGSPMKSDCVVMVISGIEDGLSFCMPGDKSWTDIDAGGQCFFDIIYHNRKLYAVNYGGWTVVECDIHGSNPKEVVQVFAFGFDDVMRKLVNMQSYLVESREKFFIVSRLYTNDHGASTFRVLEIDLKDGSFKEVDCLGNRSLFLGTNSSICVEIPESGSKLEPQHIYFTYTNTVWSRPSEGVYRLCDGRFQDLGIFGFTISAVPIWVVPSI